MQMCNKNCCLWHECSAAKDISLNIIQLFPIIPILKNTSIVHIPVDMPKGCSCNCKWQAKESWIKAVTLLRLWGCDNGVSNDSLLVRQQGVSEEDSKNVEQYVDYSNYGSLIDNRNDRYERGKTKILLSQRGEEKMQGELGCTKWSARCGERITKCEVSGSKRMKLIEGF